MLTNKHPFGSEDAEIIDGIRLHDPEALPSHISAFTKDLVSSMLEKDPAKRPDALTLLRKPQIIKIVEQLFKEKDLNLVDEENKEVIVDQFKAIRFSSQNLQQKKEIIQNAGPEIKPTLLQSYTIRCALIGDQRVGKTSIAERYTNGKFSEITEETQFSQYIDKANLQFGNKKIRLVILDTPS